MNPASPTEVEVPSASPDASGNEHAPLLSVTLYWERVRAACSGVMTANTQILVHVVAVQHFAATNAEKAWLVASSFFGLIATPFTTWIISRIGVSVTKANALIFGAGAIGFAVAAMATDFTTYFWPLIISLPLISTTIPNTTTLWRQNIPARLRGDHFGGVSLVGFASGLVASLLVTGWMGDDPSRYRPVLAGMAILLFAGSIASFKTPSRGLEPKSRFPLAPLAFLVRDPLFGYVSLAWMVMGFGNLMLLPLRVEYVGNEVYGFGYAPWLVMALLTVVPETVRILTVRLWGRAFDRMNFLLMRMILNSFFGISAILFFMPWLPMQILGSVFLGMAFGGGQIAWNLWVTKFASPERTADYMSVHTFLTGCRGLLGPMLALNLLGKLDIHTMVWTGAGMIFLACLMLLPILRYGSKGRLAPRQ